MARLSAQLNGQPVFLYSFSRDRHDREQHFLCVHSEFLIPEQVRRRVLEAAQQLPAKVDFDHRMSDLFERAVDLAGFVLVDDEILVGLILPFMSTVIHERSVLERELAR